MITRKFLFALMCLTLTISTASFSVNKTNHKSEQIEKSKENFSVIAWIKDHKMIAGTATAILVSCMIASTCVGDTSILNPVPLCTLCPETLEPCISTATQSLSTFRMLKSSGVDKYIFWVNEVCLTDSFNQKILNPTEVYSVLQQIGTNCRLGMENYSLQLVEQEIGKCLYDVVSIGTETSTKIGQILFDVWGWYYPST